MYTKFKMVQTINGDSMKDKQTIECSVYNCKYCVCDCNLCNLKKIKVALCASDDNKQATMCDSFKERK